MAKILVVEDEPDLRELIVENLEDEGHQTFEACNGQEGLDRLAEVTPDLILSDITMPVLNGYHFFRALRENHPEHAHTPFLFLTALSSRDDELKGLRLGADGYITKPIDFEILMARIDGVLRVFRHQKALDEANPLTASPKPGPSRSGAASSPGDAQHQKEDQAPIDDAGSGERQVKARVVEITAGRFQTISLEKVRKRVGDQWREISDKIVRNAEQVIRRHLEPQDVFHKTPTSDFTVCFSQLSAEQAALKVEVICDEIWERLFGETKDACLSTVEGQAYDLTVSTDGLENASDLMAEIEAQIEEQDRKSAAAALKRIEQIYRYEDLKVIRLLGGGGLPSKIQKLEFSKKFTDELGIAFKSKGIAEQDLIDLQKLFFEQLNHKIGQSEAIAKAATIITVDFAMISADKVRKYWASYCKLLQERMTGVLIIEIVGTPDHFIAHIEELEPLPIGRRLQVLEFAKFKQLSGLDFKQLHCAILSLRYADLLDIGAENLQTVKKTAKRHNIKLYIKDIPEGGMLEAQKARADLYSLQH